MICLASKYIYSIDLKMLKAAEHIDFAVSA